MQKWLLPSLSEILAQSSNRAEVGQTGVMENNEQQGTSRTASARVKAEREWCGAIMATEDLLLSLLSDSSRGEALGVKGLVLAGPVPVLSHLSVISNFQTGIFNTSAFNAPALMPWQLPPATATCTQHSAFKFPLLPEDPLTAEQFCLVFTSGFSLLLVLGEDTARSPVFQFSFDPDDTQLAWRSLRARLLLATPHHVTHLDTFVKEFAPTIPDYRTVMQFSRQLLKHLPEEARDKRLEGRANKSRNCVSVQDGSSVELSENPTLRQSLGTRKTQNSKSDDVELLQALTHEIRTPLTTIRTLTRLLLKRRDLAPEVTKRLEIIDRECTEQINRMELIFRAVELATSEVNQEQVHLTSISLSQLLQQSIPSWQKQATRRNVTLEVVLPQQLPDVVTNPAMLDQVLTGLLENFTRNLPAGSHIQVEVTPAGDQLKLQFQSQPYPNKTGISPVPDSKRKSLGQMLMFQPETGNLSLNMNVTKNLFQVLGGKLIVRQHAKGEVLTIFLPLEVDSKSAISC